ncbi:hypothetical protein B0T14DRAFT_269652 [Immersiella caudata]|uniref:Uncharacterized protein n=1 Tax=Immersiella caudata TaxID=314043 RepID=A0AA39WL84_9PEZI|nr:hypothetical protein B0T14DRAFT_269652 [Immersiella caudata]
MGPVTARYTAATVGSEPSTGYEGCSQSRRLLPGHSVSRSGFETKRAGLKGLANNCPVQVDHHAPPAGFSSSSTSWLNPILQLTHTLGYSVESTLPTSKDVWVVQVDHELLWAFFSGR